MIAPDKLPNTSKDVEYQVSKDKSQLDPQILGYMRLLGQFYLKIVQKTEIESRLKSKQLVQFIHYTQFALIQQQ